jgi:hypothetical protein
MITTTTGCSIPTTGLFSEHIPLQTGLDDSKEILITLTEFFKLARDLAACCIQRFYKGYKIRKRMKQNVLSWQGSNPQTRVEVAGNFSNWKPVQMHWDKERAAHILRVSSVSMRKLVFKFIINGEWKLSPSFDTETDSAQNHNNVLSYF